MTARQAGWSFRAALVASLMLVLQLAATGFALGGAAAAPLDAWGNPLCVTSVDGAPQHGGRGPDHAQVPPCCTPGCPMAAAAIGPAPDTFSLHRPGRVDLDAARRHARAVTLPAPGHHPGQPRAPPLTA